MTMFFRMLLFFLLDLDGSEQRIMTGEVQRIVQSTKLSQISKIAVDREKIIYGGF